jgi:hypothetical protein
MKSFEDLRLEIVLSPRYDFVCKSTKITKRMQTFIYLNLCVTNIS